MNSQPDPAWRAAKDSAAVFDLSSWTAIRLKGRDALTFLHNLCTNDIKKLPEVSGCEAFLTNVKARVVGHVFAFDTADSDEPPQIDLLSVPGQEEKLLAHLDRYIIREDVTLSGHTDDLGILLLTGPAATERLNAAAARPIAGLSSFQSTGIGIAGAGVLCLRLDLLGTTGFLLECRRTETDLIQAHLASAGVIAARSDIFEALRIEACFPYYGIDITEDHLAPEVGRPWAISYTKGCYLGQEPIARIDALGHVNKLLRGVRLDEGPVPEPGAAVIAEGKEIGAVTSTAASLEDGKPIALAYLRSKFSEPGTVVSVRTDGGETPATVFGPRNDVGGTP